MTGSQVYLLVGFILSLGMLPSIIKFWLPDIKAHPWQILLALLHWAFLALIVSCAWLIALIWILVATALDYCLPAAPY